MKLFRVFMFLERWLKKTDFSILRIRSDRGDEFINHSFIIYCEEIGIKHELSCPRTLQQNGVIERKNRTLQEMARTMISDTDSINTYGPRP